jgi:hypothetical protein
MHLVSCPQDKGTYMSSTAWSKPCAVLKASLKTSMWNAKSGDHSPALTTLVLLRPGATLRVEAMNDAWTTCRFKLKRLPCIPIAA